MKVEHKETNEILKWFGEIAKVPRRSKEEEKMRNWLVDWAKKNNFQSKVDKGGNLVINVPGTSGYEKSPAVILQGHLDMVCEKTPESTHDFNKDPIKLVYKGDWLTADGTSLGSDNGIAIAMAMTIALDKDASHPPLEFLFTVDEETGLTGANALEKGLLQGKVLINIDSEKEGYFTVGCSGGITSATTLPVKQGEAPSGYRCVKISAGGMKGGHSGIQIHEGRANALIVTARTLKQTLNQCSIQIADVKGGSAHNAIPRDAEATVFIKDSDLAKAEKIVADCNKTIKQEFKRMEPNLEISFKKEGGSFKGKVLTAEATKYLVNFMLAMPHGVAAMSADIKDLVETSNNFASIAVKGNAVEIITSQRSSLASRLSAQTEKIEALATLAGASMKNSDGYPGWSPDMDSELLKKSVAVYEGLFKKKPIIEAIHAGLECGIIGAKYPGMDMISFGPTLESPHSPDERIHVGSIGKVYDLLKALLKTLK